MPPAYHIAQYFCSPLYTCSDGIDDLEGENTLDVEWSHAIAPGAKIVLLIGANDSGGLPGQNCSFVGLQDAARYTIEHRLGQVISMSYGGSELGDVSDTPLDKDGERQYYSDGHTLFQQAAQAGSTVIASSGDTGATNPNDHAKPSSYWNRPNVSWPASDFEVLAVGGTQLKVDPQTGKYLSEQVWNIDQGASGGGLSTVFDEPTYQKNLPNQSLLGGHRAVPDVAFPADDILVYEAFSPGTLIDHHPEWEHWDVVGGTSVGAPCWAGLIAIADQMRGKPLGLVQPALYSLAGKDMHDIVMGDNSFGQVTGFQATKGFDLATGWGTPIANTFLPALVKAANMLGG